MSNIKLIILLVLVMAGIITGAVLISATGGTQNKASITKTPGAKVFIDHTSKIVGDISYGKGILYHSFPIKNVGTKDLEIANIVTSCMCTKAFLRLNKKDGPSFGMKGMSAPSSWKGLIHPGENGEIIAAFDPAYHGSSGIGSVTRTVSFETNDPDLPYAEVTFQGEVIK